MDTLSREKRSWNMSRIKSKNTMPEIHLRSMLHKMGYRFRLHVKNLSGKPDIVLPRYKTVIFVQGCFWHRHKNCKYTYMPKTRVKFWKNKFRQNVARYKKVKSELKKDGWKVVELWECKIENNIKQLERIVKTKICKN